jgi:hypothetical protein
MAGQIQQNLVTQSMSALGSGLGQYQNNIAALPNLNIYRYEKIFKLYQTDNNQYFYNIIQSVFLPDELDKRALFYITVQKQQPWTTISYNVYKTIELWWLILLTNKIYNPFELPLAGTVLSVIKPEYIPDILREINAKLQ